MKEEKTFCEHSLSIKKNKAIHKKIKGPKAF